MRGKLFIVSAPSGAGKTSLVDEILVRLKPEYPINRLVTYTSREIRKGEKEGVDFCYVSPKEFEIKIKNDFFLEWSKAYYHYYGTPQSLLNELEGGNSRILVIDKNGAMQVVRTVSNVVTIWISPPSIDILKERLEKRGLNSPNQIKKRLEIAKIELEQEQKNRFYKHHIVNNIFENAADELERLFVCELLK